jgi:oligoribonuclease
MMQNQDEPSKKNEKNRLVWLDMEMSGLNPNTRRVLEVATIITDINLETIATGPVLVVHQDDTVLTTMDQWNIEHHGESGLIERVRKSVLSERDVENQTIQFLEKHLKKKDSPLCGNTIGQDRRFLLKYMPELDDFFHYRSIDVSSLKELVMRWYPSLPRFKKQSKHTALEDIKESIEELKYYRKHCFNAHPHD